MDYKKAKLLYKALTIASLLSLVPLAIYNRLIIGCFVLFFALYAAALAVGIVYLKCPHCGKSLITGRKISYCPDCGGEVEK